MDEKLQNLFKIRQLQDEVITLRTEMPAIYDKYLKRSQSIQLKRLLKVKIDMPVMEITIPDQGLMWTSNQQIRPRFKTQDIENDCKDMEKVYDFIS